MTQGLESLNIKIFADGADLEGMISLYRNPLIKGLDDKSDTDAQGRYSGL